MKKGFTLIELIIVIALLGVLAILVVPNLIEMRNETLTKEYNSLKERIKSAALEYGYDNINDLSNTCFNVTVNTLIDNNYLSADNDGKLYNSLTGEELNEKSVCIKYIFCSETTGNTCDDKNVIVELDENW